MPCKVVCKGGHAGAARPDLLVVARAREVILPKGVAEQGDLSRLRGLKALHDPDELLETFVESRMAVRPAGVLVVDQVHPRLAPGRVALLPLALDVERGVEHLVEHGSPHVRTKIVDLLLEPVEDLQI